MPPRIDGNVAMHAVTKQFSALALTLAALSTAACGGDNMTLPGNNTGGMGNGGMGTGGEPPVIAPTDCASTPPPRAPLRRLTRYEYNNTARDLLGDTTSPANAFPSELLGNGFGNDADSQPVGSELANQYMLVSETVAAAATTPARIGSLAACAAQVTAATDATTEAACVRSIVDGFTPKAWRRALLPGEGDSLVALFTAVRATSDFPTSVATMLEAILQSPEFIYKPEFGSAAIAGKPHLMQPTGDEIATRLSYLFWASLPDDALRAAAAAGQLATAQGVRTQAERLLNDPKAKEVVAHFFDKLLPISELSALNRDPAEYPAFSPKIGSLMRQETQTFLTHQIFSGEVGAGTWPSVFTADYTFVNQELATFYGIAGIAGDTFQKAPLDTSQRRGLLTHAGVLAGPIHTNHENPVVRGSFVVQKLLCNPIPFPSGDVAAKVTPPDPNSAATARQRFTQHSLDPVCRACHQNMDPVGYALEQFDVIGQYRTQENGVTIDVSGQTSLLGDTPFNGAIELGQRIAASEDAQECFAGQWMNFGYGRTVVDDETCSIASVQNKFKETGYNIKELLLALTQSDAFLYLPTVRK
jgi:hypothetical protein